MTQVPTTITPSALTFFDAVSLFSSIAGLVLAVVAIWLSWRFKDDADKVNQRTQAILTEIRADAKVITDYAVSELKEWGTHARGEITTRNTVTASTAAVQPAQGFNVRFDPKDTSV